MNLSYVFQTLRKTTYTQYAILAGFIYSLFMGIAPMIAFIQGDITFAAMLTSMYSIGYAYSMIFVLVMVGLFVGYTTKLYLSMGMKIENVRKHYHLFSVMTLVYGLVGAFISALLGLFWIEEPLHLIFFGTSSDQTPLKLILFAAVYFMLFLFLAINLLAFMVNCGNNYGYIASFTVVFFSVAAFLFALPTLVSFVLWMNNALMITLCLILLNLFFVYLNDRLILKTEVKK